MKKLLSLIALVGISFGCAALDINNDREAQQAEQELEQLLADLEKEPKIFEELEEEKQTEEEQKQADVVATTEVLASESQPLAE